jgi:hypothetical protein
MRAALSGSLDSRAILATFSANAPIWSSVTSTAAATLWCHWASIKTVNKCQRKSSIASSCWLRRQRFAPS